MKHIILCLSLTALFSTFTVAALAQVLVSPETIHAVLVK